MYMPKSLKKGETEQKMEYLFYLFIFIIGIVFGSFYTLAVYRIPKKEDILHTHSYCPECQHKLGFLDLIPLFSYAFLRGKCRYCGKKIRPRYFIIEFISGCFFVALAYLMKFNVENLTAIKAIDFSFMVLYFTYIILMAGIDKENRQIQKGVNIYGIAISIGYMIYLYIIEEPSIYRYGIYLMFSIVCLGLDSITFRKYAKHTYIYGLIITTIIMAIFTGEFVMYETVLTVLLAIAIYVAIKKIQNKRKKDKEPVFQKMQIGYMLGIANIAFFLFVMFCQRTF